MSQPTTNSPYDKGTLVIPGSEKAHVTADPPSDLGAVMAEKLEYSR